MQFGDLIEEIIENQLIIVSLQAQENAVKQSIYPCITADVTASTYRMDQQGAIQKDHGCQSW